MTSKSDIWMGRWTFFSFSIQQAGINKRTYFYNFLTTYVILLHVAIDYVNKTKLKTYSCRNELDYAPSHTQEKELGRSSAPTFSSDFHGCGVPAVFWPRLCWKAATTRTHCTEDAPQKLLDLFLFLQLFYSIQHMQMLLLSFPHYRQQKLFENNP